MKTQYYYQWGLFALLLLADQASKHWIELQEPTLHITVIDHFFNIIVAHNYGVAFSMFADWQHAWRTAMLVGITSAIALLVLAMWWRVRHSASLEAWLLPVILAGAVGNIWDRIQLGYVVDFIQWYVVIDDQAYYWPTFNIADSCITVAVVLLLVDAFIGKQED